MGPWPSWGGMEPPGVSMGWSDPPWGRGEGRRGRLHHRLASGGPRECKAVPVHHHRNGSPVEVGNVQGSLKNSGQRGHPWLLIVFEPTLF